MAGIVVVFDFDQTIIDCDSDKWVIGDLGGSQLLEKIFLTMPRNSAMDRMMSELHAQGRSIEHIMDCDNDKWVEEILLTMPWNSAMDWMMSELHAQGRSIEHIADSLKRVPLPPKTISAIKAAYASGCELRIVSDANLFFIETILKHHGLLGFFSEINTSPSYIDEVGRLRIFPYHDFTTPPHGCSLCSPNMCKGLIIERIRASALAKGKKRFIYLGDEKNDYCPSLRLSEEDCVMPRKNYPLWDQICSNTRALKAGIHEWSDAEELERVLLRLINYCNTSNASIGQMPSVDCKFQSIPLSTHEDILQALPVPQ